MAKRKSETPQQVKFVEHDATGLPVKRKQVQQACLPCRKRKKRCHHPAILTDDEGPTQAQSQSPPDRDTSDAAVQLLSFFHHTSDKTVDSSMDISIDSSIDYSLTRHHHQPHFIEPAAPFLGDTNPEGILFEAAMAPPEKASKTPQREKSPDGRKIGVIAKVSQAFRRTPKAGPQSQADAEVHVPAMADAVSGPFFSIPHQNGTRLELPVHDTANFGTFVQSFINARLASKVIPPLTEWFALRDLYLANIHPIFPIFGRSFLAKIIHEKPKLRELIQASVCLAAATDPGAGSFLTFNMTQTESPSGQTPPPRTVVSVEEYSREVGNFIIARLGELEKGQEISLANRLRIMAITCLYWQPTHPNERFEPHTLFAKLVSLCHTHGVHLNLLEKGSVEGLDEGSGSRLFKCLYALDRLLSAFAGRPIMFHNVDMMNVPEPDEKDPPSFRLFMSLIVLLDQVIEMYRPSPTVHYLDVPVFERLIINAKAQRIQQPILATLEVLYHAICVLSVRMPRDRFRITPECDEVQGASTKHLPASGLNARRSHSADRILDVIQGYKLVPMPFVPYALTLSLSVAYRKWRFSQIPMFQTRGGVDFKKVLPVLQEMGGTWTSVRIHGELGQDIMEKLDQCEAETRRKKHGKASEKMKQLTDKIRAKKRPPPAEIIRLYGQDHESDDHGRLSSLPAELVGKFFQGTWTDEEAQQAKAILAQGQPASSATRTSTPPAQPPSAETINSSPDRPVSDALQPLSAPPQQQRVVTRQERASSKRPVAIHHPSEGSSRDYGPGPSTRTGPAQFIDPNPIRSVHAHLNDAGYVMPPDPSSSSAPVAGAEVGPSFSTGNIPPPPPPPPPAGVLGESSTGNAGSGGGLNDTLLNDAELFGLLDPQLTQTADAMFSNLLDLGVPFAWPGSWGGVILKSS